MFAEVQKGLKLPLTDLYGVGAAIEKKLNHMGIHTITDLLFHLPKTYQDRTRLAVIAKLTPGMHVVIEGEIVKTEVRHGRRKMLLCHIADHTGYIILRFFHFRDQQVKQMREGMLVRCYGEVKLHKQFEMVHPEYKVLEPGNKPPLENTLTPIYPATEGLTQGRLRSLVKQAFDEVAETDLVEYLPENISKELSFPTLFAALKFVHNPPISVNADDILSGRHVMQQRLVFEELLAHRLSLRKWRQTKYQAKAHKLAPSKDLSTQLIKSLPFKLTKAQSRVGAEISKDLASGKAMLRLLQGDVGSGKTLVAVLAILQAVEAGFQALIMAPTEILAEQHYLNFTNWLEPLGVPITWLVGKLKTQERRDALADLASGDVSVVVGTQALFQAGVEFKNLALIVVDEQHRFGVEQRKALSDKGASGNLKPHQLVMTATPIPRTLAMTVYADLDVSIIDELPPGRVPVTTVAMSDQRRIDVINRIKEMCKQGRQAYWVCTLIEESEALTSQAAIDAMQLLQHELKGFSVGLVHGRMKSTEKAQTMADFKAKKIDVLVATTVIEVGVDVPNASLMIIENPERLGLSQLHQLRGRVGRGSVNSFCVLMYHQPLSQASRARLQAMRETTDGFKIAETDLKLRGPGELLGTRQAGDVSFKIASLLRDQAILEKVQSAADKILLNHQSSIEPLIKRWLGDASLVL